MEFIDFSVLGITDPVPSVAPGADEGNLKQYLLRGWQQLASVPLVKAAYLVEESNAVTVDLSYASIPNNVVRMSFDLQTGQPCGLPQVLPKGVQALSPTGRMLLRIEANSGEADFLAKLYRTSDAQLLYTVRMEKVHAQIVDDKAL